MKDIIHIPSFEYDGSKLEEFVDSASDKLIGSIQSTPVGVCLKEYGAVPDVVLSEIYSKVEQKTAGSDSPIVYLDFNYSALEKLTNLNNKVKLAAWRDLFKEILYKFNGSGFGNPAKLEFFKDIVENYPLLLTGEGSFDENWAIYEKYGVEMEVIMGWIDNFIPNLRSIYANLISNNGLNQLYIPFQLEDVVSANFPKTLIKFSGFPTFGDGLNISTLYEQLESGEHSLSDGERKLLSLFVRYNSKLRDVLYDGAEFGVLPGEFKDSEISISYPGSLIDLFQHNNGDAMFITGDDGWGFGSGAYDMRYLVMKKKQFNI